jgi:hypothetical protein
VTTQLPAVSVFSLEPDLVHTFFDDFATDIDTAAFGETVLTPTCTASDFAEYFFLALTVLEANSAAAASAAELSTTGAGLLTAATGGAAANGEKLK